MKIKASKEGKLENSPLNAEILIHFRIRQGLLQLAPTLMSDDGNDRRDRADP